jgi:hypothetical protein
LLNATQKQSWNGANEETELSSPPPPAFFTRTLCWMSTVVTVNERKIHLNKLMRLNVVASFGAGLLFDSDGIQIPLSQTGETDLELVAGASYTFIPTSTAPASPVALTPRSATDQSVRSSGETLPAMNDTRESFIADELPPLPPNPRADNVRKEVDTVLESNDHELPRVDDNSLRPTVPEQVSVGLEVVLVPFTPEVVDANASAVETKSSRCETASVSTGEPSVDTVAVRSGVPTSVPSPMSRAKSDDTTTRRSQRPARCQKCYQSPPAAVVTVAGGRTFFYCKPCAMAVEAQPTAPATASSAATPDRDLLAGATLPRKPTRPVTNAAAVRAPASTHSAAGELTPVTAGDDAGDEIDIDSLPTIVLPTVITLPGELPPFASQRSLRGTTPFSRKKKSAAMSSTTSLSVSGERAASPPPPAPAQTTASVLASSGGSKRKATLPAAVDAPLPRAPTPPADDDDDDSDNVGSTVVRSGQQLESVSDVPAALARALSSPSALPAPRKNALPSTLRARAAGDLSPRTTNAVDSMPKAPTLASRDAITDRVDEDEGLRIVNLDAPAVAPRLEHLVRLRPQRPGSVLTIDGVRQHSVRAADVVDGTVVPSPASPPRAPVAQPPARSAVAAFRADLGSVLSLVSACVVRVCVCVLFLREAMYRGDHHHRHVLDWKHRLNTVWLCDCCAGNKK